MICNHGVSKAIPCCITSVSRRNLHCCGPAMLACFCTIATCLPADDGEAGVQERTAVADLELRPLPSLSATMPMYDVLHLFKIGRAHMAILKEANEGVLPLSCCFLHTLVVLSHAECVCRIWAYHNTCLSPMSMLLQRGCQMSQVNTSCFHALYKLCLFHRTQATSRAFL